MLGSLHTNLFYFCQSLNFIPKTIQLNLPAPLIQSLQNIKGFDEEAFRQVHESGEQVISVRINPNKISNVHPAIGGTIFNSPLEKVPWSSNGYYLPQRPSFTLDPLFHAGAYYVQEASSMFLEIVLKQTLDLSRPLKVLDLCAAPGGKSTLIQSLISPDSLLVSNELIKARVNVLSENITKWGSANVIVTNNDPADFKRLQNYFDVIVVDAPCSGSGLFRKDPAAVEEWNENNVQFCSQRQQRILADILPSLKEGGILIYSTCSYSEQEDEAIADWLVANCHLSSVNLQLQIDWNIIETGSVQQNAYGYRFYPDKIKGEGFYIASFQKNLPDNFPVVSGAYQGKLKQQRVKFPAIEIAVLENFLKDANDFIFIRQNEEVIAVPKQFENDLAVMQSALYLKKAGVKLGAVIRNELIPHHELAVSTVIDEKILRVEADLKTALDYLRRFEINLETSQKGWVLLTYAQLPLGWIKILPHRINNYYPSGWRILNK